MQAEIDFDFAPEGLIANPHLQSVLVSSPFRRSMLRRRGAALEEASRDLVLDCGEGVRLHSWHAPQPQTQTTRGLVVLLHGWEGSGESSYLISAATRMYAEGWEVIRLHLRDHGPSHHLNEGIFHSCLIREAVGAVARIAALFPARPICLAGYSLGGNFALRIAARAPAADIPLARVMAVCPVLDPASTLEAMEHGPRFYERYFMAKWRRSLEIKAQLFPELYDFGNLRRFRGLRDMTDTLAREYTEFATLQSYLDGYSIVGDALAGIAAPTLLVCAEDDPVIPVRDLPRLASPAVLQVVATTHGGHCGFLPSPRGESLIDEQMASWFAPVAA